MKYSTIRQKLGIFSLALTVIVQAVGLTPAVGFCATSQESTDGLKVEYYDNAGFTNFKMEKEKVESINFEWGTGSPVENIAPKTYSVRWTGKLVPSVSGIYTFYTLTSGGVKLWLDNKLIIDNMAQHNATEDKSDLTSYLTADKEYTIKMEYSNTNKDSVAKLLWETDNLVKEVIPKSAFRLPEAVDLKQLSDSDKDGIPDIWELDGYCFSTDGRLQKWNGDMDKMHFKTSPITSDTNSNGKSDYEEALKLSLGTAKRDVGNDPMVSLNSGCISTYASAYSNVYSYNRATITLEDINSISQCYNIFLDGESSVTVAEAVLHTMGDMTNGKITINGTTIDSNWNVYFTGKDLETALWQVKQMNEKSKDLLNVVLKPGMNVTLTKMNTGNVPVIKWSGYSDVLNTVFASITPMTNVSNSVYANVYAKVKVDGKETSIPLIPIKNSSLYYNDSEVTGVVDVKYQGVIAVDYKNENNSNAGVSSLIGASPIMDKEDSMYVSLQTPMEVLSAASTKNAASGSYQNSDLLAKYPDANAFVFEVTSDRWSSTSGSVSINDNTVYFGTGDSHGDGAWSVKFYYDRDYSKWWKTHDPDTVSGHGDAEYASCGSAGVRNNQANSLEISSGAKVILYEDNDFNGTNKGYSSNKNDLGRDTSNRFEMSSFKVIAPKSEGAKNSPVNTKSVVVARPSTAFVINWGDFIARRVNGNEDSDASISVKIVGYYSEAQGSRFNLYENSDNKIELTGMDNTTGTKATGVTNATGYLVKVTSDRISTDDVKVDINGVSAHLGTSDSSSNGENAGANRSPVHSTMLYVPAQVANAATVNVATTFSSWKNSVEKTPKVTVEILGYYAPSASMVYKQLDLTGLDNVIVSDLSTTDLKANIFDINSPQLFENTPKAYMLEVTANGVGTDYLNVDVNGSNVKLGTSGTKGGNIRGVSQTETLIAKADITNPYRLVITPSISDFKVNGTIQVRVIGYYY